MGNIGIDLVPLANNAFLTPATLAMRLWPDGEDKWLPQKHLMYASAKIANAIRNGNGRIIISMPPRHGKSRLVSETTIPWFLNEYPGRHVILAAYNSELATKFGRQARDIIIRRPDLFSVKIRRDVKRADFFMTESGSEVYFVGLRGGATGKGADLLVIDDYIKGFDEAISPTFLSNCFNGYLTNLSTRVGKNGSIIILATRWATGDLIGRVLENNSEIDPEYRWEYIEFPALAIKDDILGRKVGEPLFPERFSLKRLLNIKSERAGTYLWESLYQQRPIDNISELTNVEWIRIVPKLEIDMIDKLDKVRAWDMAATEGGGDYTVGTLAGKDTSSGRGYILDIKRDRLSSSNVEKLILGTAEMDGIDTTVLLEEEPGSQGKALINHYKVNVLAGFNVESVPTGNKSKVVRAHPFIAAIEAKKMLLEEGIWNKAFISEFGAFPPSSTGNDDQIDTAAMCFNWLFKGKSPLSAVWWAKGGDNVEDISYYTAKELGIHREKMVSKKLTGAIW